MSDTVWAAIVGGSAGVLAGGISSLVAPWANWQIDKHRKKLEYKRELIARWRDMLGSVLTNMKHNQGKGYYWFQIENHPTFTSLRPHLKTESWEEMRTLNDEHECHLFLVKKVGEIEKKWDLI